MTKADLHVREVEAKITAVSDCLARLGNGTTLRDLIKLIHFPGYTTPAELALTMGMLENMLAQGQAMEKMQAALLHGTKMIVKAE